MDFSLIKFVNIFSAKQYIFPKGHAQYAPFKFLYNLTLFSYTPFTTQFKMLLNLFKKTNFFFYKK
ncbi:hypothetical protein DRH27_00180 [Candidatus Falkowbacteria bacterium]|nr:MAG: hypothetical protein DRH27_00180 [Candidatus Falkowbacteria bacterium]